MNSIGHTAVASIPPATQPAAMGTQKGVSDEDCGIGWIKGGKWWKI